MGRQPRRYLFLYIAGFVNPGGMGVGVNMGLGGGQMTVNLGGGGFGFNRWGANNGYNYQTMNGFQAVDYSNGWNPNYHDQLLRNNIDLIYQRYDMNFSGQLEGQEFFFAYRDLCLMMGMAPPMDFQTVYNAAASSDTNFNGRTSKIELFMLFKRIQGINMNMGMNNGW